MELIKFEKGEEIVAEVRKHKYILFVEASFLSFFAVAPPVLYAMLNKSGYLSGFDGGLSLFFFVYFIILLFSVISLSIIWTDFYFDILIITNKRLIDFEQKSLFNRELSILRLDRIQDITVQVNGVIATMLKFGDIHIQTAGEAREFVIKSVPEPDKIKSIIYSLYRRQVEAPKSFRMVSDDK